MKEKAQFKFLVHCNIHQIREGFEANIKSLPHSVEISYSNLLQEGIMSELKFTPHLIVILHYECDSDFLLPFKVKLFARDIPMLIVLPAIPDHYYHLLKIIGVEHIIQLPASDELICKTIINMLQLKYHGNP